MIPLFHIPHHIIDTSKFSHMLHDKIVREFEERFAEYVGARYAVSLHSATAGIFLCMQDEFTQVAIPSILPPVVANAICTAGSQVIFEDKPDWVGHSYLLHEWVDCKFIDSAHRVERDQYKKECEDSDIMLFSFFPTKIISSQDGGMIVSNDEKAIETLRVLANNGVIASGPSWNLKPVSIGYKLYMNSTAAYIAMKNMDNLEEKKDKLAHIRSIYNKSLDLDNTSEHLYRVRLEKMTNREFCAKAYASGIICGIHYQALHQNPIFGHEGGDLPLSDYVGRQMVSIPYHEMLSIADRNKVIEFVKRNR